MSEVSAEKSDGDGKGQKKVKAKVPSASSECTCFKKAIFMVLLLAGVQIFAGVFLAGGEVDRTPVEFPKRTFDTVFGHEVAKGRIGTYLDAIKMGREVELPWFLAVGPRGTGKRSFARACASDLNGALIPIKVSDVKDNPSTLNQMIGHAKELIWRGTPLVLFLDVGSGLPRQSRDEDFSALLGVSYPRRVLEESTTSKEDLENTLLKVLTEIGYLEKVTPIVTIISSDTSTTQGLVKDRRVVRLNFRFPTRSEREAMLKELLKDDEVASKFANNTHGLNGGHLSKIYKAVRNKLGGEIGLLLQDLEDATEELEEDEEVRRLLPWERQVVAFHEAGHVVTAWQSEDSDDVTEVSILPGEDGALGCTKYASSGKLLHTNDMLMVKMVVALAGQVSEKAFFGGLTTGGRDDLFKLTKIAYMRVANFGMEDGFKVSYGGQANFARSYGERVTEAIDARVFEIVERVLKRSEALVFQNLGTIGKVAKTLLETDLLDHEDITAIIGPRPMSRGDKKDWPCKIQDPLLDNALEVV